MGSLELSVKKVGLVLENSTSFPTYLAEFCDNGTTGRHRVPQWWLESLGAQALPEPLAAWLHVGCGGRELNSQRSFLVALFSFSKRGAVLSWGPLPAHVSYGYCPAAETLVTSLVSVARLAWSSGAGHQRCQGQAPLGRLLGQTLVHDP